MSSEPNENFPNSVVQPKKDVSPEYPALLSLDEQWRLKILFVKAGFAQAGDFVIEPTYRIVNRQLIPDGIHDVQLAEGIKSELELLGFSVRYITDKQLNGRIYFSETPETVTNLMTSEVSDSATMSKLYGIPVSSIQAYPDNVLDLEEYPDEIKTHPLYMSLPFMLSKDHYREEWTEYINHVKSLKQKVPELVGNLQLTSLVDQAELD